ncbi:tyrosine-type recombinase/integrase [Williamsia sp. DF01-3]|uniref:tyrosine-type recombinase/integrase n=1 Tax=Williamsia sp. DF01-3 TaxID=2934157 RepID=UPI001FF1CE15|nr:tyrosine-type recombinase/integrase [Williamsia sp. DF01-3]MCK0516967.1 site-specific integrase [Williamsia sp. DF01-3]
MKNDDRETVEQYLTSWLAQKKRTLKPLTHYSYSEYVNKRIIPSLGNHRLQQLRHEDLVQFVTDLEEEGRGVPTIKRILAVLRSALGDAERTKRLSHNPAEHVHPGRVERTEIQPWTAQQAVAFLDHVTGAPPWQVDPLANLFETIIGTGLRRGEALALQWSDINVETRTMYVHRAVSDVGGKLIVGTTKTSGSTAGVGLSLRVVRALERQRQQQQQDRAKWGEGYDDQDLVFAREDGAMLRPERVLKRFRTLSTEAGLPTCRLHDLRHLAATLMLTNGVPLALVSKTLRHSQVSITADLYGHLTPEAAHAAADALGAALDVAAAEAQSERSARNKTTSRPHQPV